MFNNRDVRDTAELTNRDISDSIMERKGLEEYEKAFHKYDAGTKKEMETLRFEDVERIFANDDKERNERIEEKLFQRNDEQKLNAQLKEREVDFPEKKLEQTLDDYFSDLKEKSECSDTISGRPFNSSDLKKQLPEITAEKREEFAGKKAELKKQWEHIYERPWPKYEHDIYSANGKLIRLAGGDQDAHHIQPLSMGGKNEVSNITPLSAEVHYDKQGVHSPDSPYSRLEKILGGIE